MIYARVVEHEVVQAGDMACVVGLTHAEAPTLPSALHPCGAAVHAIARVQPVVAGAAVRGARR